MGERSSRAVLAPILFAVALAEVLIAIAARHRVGPRLELSAEPFRRHQRRDRRLARSCGLADRLAATTQSDRLAAVGRWRVLCGLGCRVLPAGLGVVRRR